MRPRVFSENTDGRHDGCGGGKPDSAMGGGKDVTKVDNALAMVDDFVASKLQ